MMYRVIVNQTTKGKIKMFEQYTIICKLESEETITMTTTKTCRSSAIHWAKSKLNKEGKYLISVIIFDEDKTQNKFNYREIQTIYGRIEQRQR
tara:strand:+ start:16174 stop:16452 length:279 start_codon:yes stop_codon:yes gene_type:complete